MTDARFWAWVSDGTPGHFIDEGIAINVNGEEMARFGAVIHPAKDCHPTKQAALLWVADRFEQLAERVMAKAAAVRREAAHD